LNIKWQDKTISENEILSKSGKIYRINRSGISKITTKRIASKTNANRSIEFKTIKEGLYKLIRK